eukprot:TRINITY_DN47109_c0_g1_i1.p1 TRINITY_DN47109_c0_g1~~TRINITY_DN47109_c0_g1_i1.p1  ORF type:complete len:138 (+),score=27.93 TRINITY_DN47109_c0_g1_i1:60-416(+)
MAAMREPVEAAALATGFQGGGRCILACRSANTAPIGCGRVFGFDERPELPAEELGAGGRRVAETADITRPHMFFDAPLNLGAAFPDSWWRFRALLDGEPAAPSGIAPAEGAFLDTGCN